MCVCGVKTECRPRAHTRTRRETDGNGMLSSPPFVAVTASNNTYFGLCCMSCVCVVCERAIS